MRPEGIAAGVLIGVSKLGGGRGYHFTGDMIHHYHRGGYPRTNKSFLCGGWDNYPQQDKEVVAVSSRLVHYQGKNYSVAGFISCPRCRAIYEEEMLPEDSIINPTPQS